MPVPPHRRVAACFCCEYWREKIEEVMEDLLSENRDAPRKFVCPVDEQQCEYPRCIDQKNIGSFMAECKIRSEEAAKAAHKSRYLGVAENDEAERRLPKLR